MRDGQTDVKSKGNVVGVAIYPIYDTVEEAKEKVGEARCLAMINAQIKTTSANELRQSLTKKKSTKNMMMEAMMRIPVAEQGEHAGDLAWFQNRIAEEIAVIEREQDEASDAVDESDED